ncbi:hypothetical protein AXG93_131s1190 [Marchantia polymorpha subsp. ruderalis]|uniref:Uncharacterized protein n=1 Tax=Marchantia polymorpha subsp. ruderalis TaxID=1480154 RepID=A0A176W045_MARPO|nr:hypothetical protein AXG93_131s1190 [Marchantia polymorpha subsp. ruderalis]
MLEDRAREMANCWPGTLFSRTSAIAILAAAVFMMETGRRLTVANSANQSARVQQRDQMLLQALVLRRTGGDFRSAKGREDYRKHHAPAVDEPARARSGALVGARYRSGDESSIRLEACERIASMNHPYYTSATPGSNPPLYRGQKRVLRYAIGKVPLTNVDFGTRDLLSCQNRNSSRSVNGLEDYR